MSYIEELLLLIYFYNTDITISVLSAFSHQTFFIFPFLKLSLRRLQINYETKYLGVDREYLGVVDLKRRILRLEMIWAFLRWVQLSNPHKTKLNFFLRSPKMLKPKPALKQTPLRNAQYDAKVFFNFSFLKFRQTET